MGHRQVVGYAISKRIDTPLALAALKAAIAERRACAGLHPSHRSGQPICKRRVSQGLEGSGPSWVNEFTWQSVPQCPSRELHEDDQGRAGILGRPTSPRSCRGSSTRSITPSVFTRHLAICLPMNSKLNSLSRPLKSDEPTGPASGVHSKGAIFNRRGQSRGVGLEAGAESTEH